MFIDFLCESGLKETIPMDEDDRAASSTWITQHPVYQDLMSLDVADSAQVYATFLVYLDLTEVRHWKEVVWVPCPELEAVLLEGREKEEGLLQVVYPIPARKTVCHKDLRSILDRGKPMLLCAVATDSTLVYQRLCDGMLTPDPPVDIQDQGRRHNRKRRLQT